MKKFDVNDIAHDLVSVMATLIIWCGLGGLTIMAVKFFLEQIRGIF